jgi:hypothetical protein
VRNNWGGSYNGGMDEHDLEYRESELPEDEQLTIQGEASKFIEVFIILLLCAWLIAWIFPYIAHAIWTAFWIFVGIWFASLMIGWIKTEIFHPALPMSKEEQEKAASDPWYWEKKAKEEEH